MKKIFLVFSITILLNSLFAQTGTTDGYIGVQTQISPDKQYLKITSFWQGSPADIAGLRFGDRIYKIDDKNVSELADPFSHIKGASGTWVKLTISRFTKANFIEVKVPRISIPFQDDNYVSEGTLFALIHTDGFTDMSRLDQSTMALLHDDSRDMFKYKTYDFEFTSVQDPLLEKELFKELGTQLDGWGMKRSEENPDLIILMSFYRGQKEQYTPPQQIVSTRVKTVYNWYWGFIPMPITETTTTEGFTEVSYLTILSLKFLDAKEMEGSKIPPVVWSGSMSRTTKTKTPLVDECGDYFATMLYKQFPEVSFPNSEHSFLKYYAYTGLWFNKNNLRIISEVIPESPADKAGIQKGDEIVSINGYKLPANYNDPGTNQFGKLIFKGSITGFRYLYLFSKLVFKPYDEGVNTFNFKVKRNGEKMTFEVKPEERFVFLLLKK